MKLGLYCWFAQTDPRVAELETAARHRTPWSKEVLIIVAVAVGMAVALFLWAALFRKSRPKDPHQRVLDPAAASEAGGSHGHRHGRRHRHRHRREGSTKHRNPTLQETGGLPPLRPEDELPRV
jgi:hypothetical protein